MKIKSLIFSGLLLISSFALSQENKIAFLTASENADLITDDDELAAYKWFKSFYTTNGVLLTVSSLNNNQVVLSDYQLIWLHIDNENLTGEIPASLRTNDIISKFKIYLQNGGKLLLTSHAAQYIYYVGRASTSPQIISAGTAAPNTELWTVNPNIDLTNNYYLHPIYSGLSSSNQYGYNTFRLISSGLKENHTAIWDLNQLYTHGNILHQFEKEHNARVIGTSGNNTSNNFPGIIEFFPDENYSGSSITIGLGAYEWNQNDKINPYQSNIEKLTSNAIEYLLHSKPVANASNQLIAHFPFELNESKSSVKELIGDRSFVVENNQNLRENIAGAEGNALRFDGFSTYIKARFNNTSLTDQSLSGSLWFAPESYPMMHPDLFDASYSNIAGNISTSAGFAFTLNTFGKYGFEIFIDSVKYTCYAKSPMKKYEWNLLAFNVSLNKNEIQFFNNGEIVAKSYFVGSQINYGQGTLFIGKSSEERFTGPFRTNTMNGIIDDFRIYAGESDFYTLTPTPENNADLTIPESRFVNQLHRPVFHGQPGVNWTNEPHGLIYYNNKYHLFFQKNGNGPYWGKIHWGHIISEDLMHWKETKTAIDPSDSYDIKGAWSGCVFKDELLTNGKPYLFYTSADYAKASISFSSPKDEELVDWEKSSMNPVIPSRPAGLDDDFRDPYIFKNGEKYYMIVGTKKDGKGACTLHEYNQLTKKWSNDGRIFFKSPSTDYGTFWEMPLVVPFGNGKWLFATTPLGAKNGVENLYWVGQIGSDGVFVPFSNVPGEVELGNMSKQGYGLLSPSVIQKEGKNIVIGIVPDKLSGDYNKQLGWAHLFSLPREWNLDANNQLIQTPYEGLSSLRNGSVSFSLNNNQVSNQSINLQPVNGKSLEVEAYFEFTTANTQKFGFNLRKNGLHSVQVFYDVIANTFNVDCRNTNRWVNDNNVYNGLYSTVLPEKPAGNMKMRIFLDGSILDVFINDKWAFSTRIFITDIGSDDVELFSVGTVQVNTLKAWKYAADHLNKVNDQVDAGSNYKFYFSQGKLYCTQFPEKSNVNVFDLTGKKIVNSVPTENIQNLTFDYGNIYICQLITNDSIYSQKVKCDFF